MRLEKFLNEAFEKILQVKDRASFEKHMKAASEEENIVIDRYAGEKKFSLTKGMKRKLKDSSPQERLKMLKKYSSDKEIANKSIERLVLRYGDFNVTWRLK